jgi:hypothetical protein
VHILPIFGIYIVVVHNYLEAIRNGFLYRDCKGDEQPRKGGLVYQRETIYMGLFSHDEKVGSAGFAKAESREEKGRLSLTLRNVPASVRGMFPVRVYDGAAWKEFEKIAIKDGEGSWSAEDIALKNGIRLQIVLSDYEYIYGQSKNAGQPPMRISVPEKTNVPERTDIPEKMNVPERTNIPKMTNMSEKPDVPEETEAGTLKTADMKPLKAAKEDRQFPAGPKPIEGLKEDKWEQILSIYPRIHPYGDERVYVKLEPKDFLILQEKYQKLTGNSFLLHGFYNYRYVILGKEDGYFLGVPGVYYEREKMVALMFGFEAFECEGGIAESGKFGYYLCKVEL